MGNVKQKKYSEENPDFKAVRKYQSEIAALQEKYDKANEEHDWSTRNFCYNQILAKRTNMELLVQKIGQRYPNFLNKLGY